MGSVMAPPFGHGPTRSCLEPDLSTSTSFSASSRSPGKGEHSPSPLRSLCTSLTLWAAFVATKLQVADGSGGITDDERLLYSTGQWHRDQRQRVAFETSCYFTSESELPYGCQYSRSRGSEWTLDQQRSIEKVVLLDFFRETNGRNWRSNDNWNSDRDPCWDNWYGITCNEHGYVIALELSDNRLNGILPDNFGQLTSLLKLDLSSTQPFYHMHPNPDVNNLIKNMPSFAAATKLEEIEVSGNNLENLPEDLYLNSPSLRVLCASRNQLTRLPRNLASFTALHTLELDNNMIEDDFPVDFGSLTNARYVHLQYNRLRGQIPEEILGMSRVRVFDVSHNPMLGGELPQEIVVGWPEQDYLAILNTSISGYISSLCLDVPFCWKFMYDTHKDMTWATSSDVPDIVNLTITLALSGR
ncbi:unnamed protein product [Polarella glacialis]|uniref:Leucine-rich repeat-containing N-terminal plant-type domain-containing protein n=1 Tax=Polarella glacialis TaxID=89957 RepID=A0A813I2S9_POLGL|nr:unnamed protein product [Polarella glacialis]